jgi:predicted dehydrogenase
MSLRFGLVGRGRWGRNIERTLLTFADVSVTVIARGQEPPRDLDGVLIATPSATHAEVALPFIASGLPTFIEKPMAASLADVERIREAADRSGAAVFVGHIHLFNPAFLALLDALPALGAIYYVQCETMNDKPRTDSSVLWDWLPHHLSMAQAIFGRNPVSVAAWPLSGQVNPQAATSNCLFDRVPLLSIVSWLSPIVRFQLIVFAEKGTIVFDDKARQKLVLYNVEGAASYPGYSDELPLTREMHSFLELVRSGKVDRSRIETAVSVVRTIAAAHVSMANGGTPVNV